MVPVIRVAPGQAAPAGVPAIAGAVPAAGPRHARVGQDRPGIWLHTAAAGLLVLAGAAAAVSFSAQYRLVYAARHLAVAAGLEAAIPDAAALVFACLGVALALHGRRAVRARALNAASAGASVFMNVIAAAPGWRDLAVWAMPPAAYALASDTLIGVIRTSVAARHQGPGNLAGEVTLLAVTGGVLLWLLRLTHGPGVHPGRVPHLGARRVPGRSRPPSRQPRAGCPAGCPRLRDSQGRRSRRRGEVPRAAGRRPPASWPWLRSSTGSLPPFRWDRWDASRPRSRPRST